MKRSDVYVDFVFHFQDVKHKITKVDNANRLVTVECLEGDFEGEIQTLTINSLLYSMNR